MGGGVVTLTSGVDERAMEVGLRSMERMRKKGAQCYAVRVESIKDVSKGEEWPADVAKILQEYRVVLEEPQGLPPKRDFDHYILLKEESQPVNVHPYHYAHFQNEEIERQVREMLE